MKSKMLQMITNTSEKSKKFTLIDLFRNLPLHLDEEIYSYLIPEKIKISNIHFKMFDYHCPYYYLENRMSDNSYEAAYYEKNKVIKIGNYGENMVFLSRKKNKKGNLKYYITIQSHWFECIHCYNYPECDCRDGLIDKYNYDSKIVSDDLKTALLCLFSDSYNDFNN